MRLLPRHGHVHYACGSGLGSINELEAGDRVYVNCDGRLVPITLLKRVGNHCVGMVFGNSDSGLSGTEAVEFDLGDIYVVQRQHDS
jgi:hypothetical protein